MGWVFESGDIEMIKVLHVVGSMNAGGVETWLMHVLRTIDRERIGLDFVVHTDKPAFYDQEVRRLGGRCIPCLHPARPLRYRRNFRRILRERGPYDVVHSHVHHYSGYVLRLAHQAGVPVRIAHSHASREDRRRGRPRRCYERVMKKWIGRYATCGLAASAESATALFGRNWRSDLRFRIHHCSIDLMPFREPAFQDGIRNKLGIPNEARVVGHVGRFDVQKNHAFLSKIIASFLNAHGPAHFVLVGDGPLRPEIEARVRRDGLSRFVHFAGPRHDLPELMLRCFDAFVLPSHHEGLPLVLLEAQAAGLRSLVSDSITRESAVVPDSVEFLSLGAGPECWASGMARVLDRGKADPAAALNALAASDFDVRRESKVLANFYESLVARNHE